MAKTPTLLSEIEMEHAPKSQCDSGDGSAAPASVLALASAASGASHRSSLKKTATISTHSHRRSQTIVVAGELERDHIQKSKAVEELHTELESKCKALEESQEEAQLAARIGQTLLQRNQEMGAEIESKAIELQNRAEGAEQVVRVLEKKLSLAVAQIRSLDMARTRATLEAEQLTQELEDSRTQVHVLKGDCSRAHEEVQRMQRKQERLEDKLETTQAHVSTLEAANRQLQADMAARKERIQVLESVERYNVEHISRLEIENQSICQQQHVLAHREKLLRLENDTLVSKLSTMANATKEHQARHHELEKAIVGLHGDMEDLREALSTEQTRVRQLTQMNQELEARLDRQRHVGEPPHDDPDQSSSSHMLRNGSLFFELARQMRDEMRDGKTLRPATKEVLSPEETVAVSVSPSGLDSPARSSTRTSRNPSSNNTDSVNDTDDPAEPASGEAQVVRPCRPPPPLQLGRRRSQQEEAEAVRATVAAAKSPRSLRRDQAENAKDEQDDSLLKEFFVLTAAAVKIAGGGLRNDACNIHNEDLFAEAMAHNVTFDQFHKWLELRLEGDLEISLSPIKPVVDKKLATTTAVSVPPTPARGAGITRFWSN